MKQNKKGMVRFEVRGVNDDGHVANFVETEQLVKTKATLLNRPHGKGYPSSLTM